MTTYERIIRHPFTLPSSAQSAYFGSRNVYARTREDVAEEHFLAVAMAATSLRLRRATSFYTEEHFEGQIRGEWWSTISYDADEPALPVDASVA